MLVLLLLELVGPGGGGTFMATTHSGCFTSLETSLCEAFSRGCPMAQSSPTNLAQERLNPPGIIKNLWAFSNYVSLVSKVASECPKESVVIYKPDGRGLWRSAATWRWTVCGKRLRWENLIHVKPYITVNRPYVDSVSVRDYQPNQAMSESFSFIGHLY